MSSTRALWSGSVSSRISAIGNFCQPDISSLFFLLFAAPDEMKKLYEYHRKFLPYIARIERFSMYRIGTVGVYCNYFQGRDRDGPLELLEKTKKKVFAFWEGKRCQMRVSL